MENDWYENPWKVLVVLVAGFFIAIFGGSMLGAWNAVRAGAISAAADIATFASAFATFALVSITAAYTYSTWKLVQETKDAREQEVELREQETENQKKKLRRALKKEIEMVTTWADEKIEERNFSTAQASYPTFVFESNTQDLGLLTNREMMALLNFYNNAVSLEEMIELRRTNPVPEEDIMQRMVILSEIGSQTIDTIKEHLEKDTTKTRLRTELAGRENDETVAETKQESSHEEK